MLVVLPHGACVDPEIVKMIHIRADRRQQGDMVYNVVMKTDADDNFHLLAGFSERDEAEALARECATRINKALGADEPENDDDDDDSDDEVEDDAADDTDDW